MSLELHATHCATEAESVERQRKSATGKRSLSIHPTYGGEMQSSLSGAPRAMDRGRRCCRTQSGLNEPGCECADTVQRHFFAICASLPTRVCGLSLTTCGGWCVVGLHLYPMATCKGRRNWSETDWALLRSSSTSRVLGSF